MPTLPEYKSGRAEVSEITRVTADGAGEQYFVRMPDGYLIECGVNKVRANFVADAVNCVMKWADSYPPIGVIESIVRHSFADEDKIARGKS